MTAVTFKAFRGMVPRVSSRLLPQNYAQSATNCKITSGALDPIDGPQLVSTIGRAIASMFRYRHFIADVPTDNWLTFADDTDVVLSPLSNDTEGRIYYTSTAHAPRYSNYDKITASTPYPASWFDLGISNPTTAPTVTVAGGSGTTEDRSYAVTFVLATGEESGPSPASTIKTGFTSGTWNVAGLPTAPANAATINMVGAKKRLYRSAGSTGTFAFVAELTMAATTYADTVSSTLVTDPIVTAGILPPPANLRGLISLPNGCLAGISDNEVCFSYPYRPYDWPLDNRYSFSGIGVAIVPAGTSAILMTDGYPILLSGTDPEAMSLSVMETHAPCMSKRGVVNIGGGCIYPSHDGLYLAAPGAVTKLTAKLFREEEFQALNPSTFVATYQDGQYYAVHEGQDGIRRMLVLDVSEADSTLAVLQEADAIQANPYDGKLYFGLNQKVYQFDEDAGNSYVSEWKSMSMQLGKPTNFSWAQVHAEFGSIVQPDTSQADSNAALMAAGALAVSGQLLGSELNTFEVNGSNLILPKQTTLKKVQFTLFKDGQAVFSRDVTSSNPFRLPAGYKSEVQSCALSSSVRAYSVSLAESTAELMGVS